jgi:hypothetical protein
MPSGVDRKLEISKLIRERYSALRREEKDSIVDGIGQFLKLAMSSRTPMHTILTDAAKLTHRNFEFQYVSIAMKDPTDEKFRYVAMVGLRDEVKTLRQNLSYTLVEMMDTRSNPSTRVNKIIEIHLMEDKPLKEGGEGIYNRPSLIGKNRGGSDSMVEGDYIELSILGPNDELIGWIEVSSPRDNKFPSRSTVKWIEFVSIITATFLKLKETAKGSAR